jgi:hypothetical protein
MIPVRLLFEKISSRQFHEADAKDFIKRSYYFAGLHADVHIILTGDRPADLHFQDDPTYEERAVHSMFLSMDDAAGALASSLNCPAGEAAMRFLSVSGVNKVVLYSRSGVRGASEMMLRAAVESRGARTGTMYSRRQTEFVVVVLGIRSERVVLTTAYPAQIPAEDKLQPPEGFDLLEYRKTPYTYPSA